VHRRGGSARSRIRGGAAGGRRRGLTMFKRTEI
jgi:hypothetical protein